MKLKCNLVIIIGLPASGKTSWIKNNYANYNILDDFYDFSLLNGVNSDTVISSVMLTEKRNRDKLKPYLKDFNVEWIFFENDLKQCLRNNKKRKFKYVSPNTIIFYSKRYFLPNEIVPIPVFKGNDKC